MLIAHKITIWRDFTTTSEGGSINLFMRKRRSRNFQAYCDPSSEYLWAIDSRGRVLAKRTRAESHRRGVIHRAVHVIVLDPKGRVLVKKRSESKDMFPSQWETSVGGHVTYGDNTQETATRELEEELGISETPLFLGRLRYRGREEKENITLFYVITEKKPKLNLFEATRGEYVTIHELETALERRRFVDGSREELEVIKRLLSKLQKEKRRIKVKESI